MTPVNVSCDWLLLTEVREFKAGIVLNFFAAVKLCEDCNYVHYMSRSPLSLLHKNRCEVAQKQLT